MDGSTNTGGREKSGKDQREEMGRLEACVRQQRRIREGDGRLDGRAFKAPTVDYPTCCDHVMGHMSGMQGRPSLLLLHFYLLCLLLPSPSIASLCFPSLLFCVSLAGTEHSWADGHLALAAYSVWLCLPASLPGRPDQCRPDCCALPSVDGL